MWSWPAFTSGLGPLTVQSLLLSDAPSSFVLRGFFTSHPFPYRAVVRLLVTLVRETVRVSDSNLGQGGQPEPCRQVPTVPEPTQPECGQGPDTDLEQHKFWQQNYSLVWDMWFIFCLFVFLTACLFFVFFSTGYWTQSLCTELNPPPFIYLLFWDRFWLSHYVV